MGQTVIKSYGKINIALNVLDKRDDGFHNLDMIMVPIELHDTILFSKLKNSNDNFVTIDDFTFGNIQYNLASLAIEKLQEDYKLNQHFRVLIHKVLPISAGLGGGSSNAAYCMVGVNKIMKLGLSNETLCSIGQQFGKDIPFFILSKPMRCQGTGNEFTPIEIKNNYYVLIVKPKAPCSTRVVFEKADTMELEHGNVEDVIKALKEGDDDLLAKSMFNSLQNPAISIVPEIKKVIDSLKNDGLKMVQMSGSGSSVFALSTDKRLLQKIAYKYEDDYFVEVTRILK